MRAAACTWYHCTPDDHGPLWVASRIVPTCSDKREPPVPRLCVCRWVPDCFGARLFRDSKKVWVYRTVKRCRGIMPAGVWDARLTGERWLVPPVQLERIGYVPGAMVAAVQAGAWWFHRQTQAPSTVERRAAQLATAWDTLGPLWHPGAAMVKKWATVWAMRHTESMDDFWLNEAIKEARKQCQGQHQR